jgi:hypothetical protein
MLKKNTIYINQIITLEILKNYLVINNKNLIDKKHTANLVLKDMLYLVKMWYHIKGYPSNGQTKHTNSNTAKKNKRLLNFRVNQFYQLFGKKKRDIYPVLVQAEYTNRLWYKLWWYEWIQAAGFMLDLLNVKTESIPFDPVNLAKGQTNGYIRTGKAAKIGKSKKITNKGTIGVPLFFTRCIYYEQPPKDYPFYLIISDDIRKKMGKKKKKKWY